MLCPVYLMQFPFWGEKCSNGNVFNCGQNFSYYAHGVNGAHANSGYL